MNYIYIDTSGKDASHPHHGVGHSRGFLVATGAAPDHTGSGFIFSPTLDLIRGGEYYFFQEATGNAYVKIPRELTLMLQEGILRRSAKFEIN